MVGGWLFAGCRLLVISRSLSYVLCSYLGCLLVVVRWLLVVGCVLVVGSWLSSVVCCWLLVACCLLVVVC